MLENNKNIVTKKCCVSLSPDNVEQFVLNGHRLRRHDLARSVEIFGGRHSASGCWKSSADIDLIRIFILLLKK
jgi:hypothetical protein